MMVNEVTTAGAVPVLEAMVRFAGARQRVLAHNVANIDTPNFRPMDASPGGFQAALREAVEARRTASGGASGELPWRDTREVRMRDGKISLEPRTPSGNILFHDRNNRDLERMMRDLAENLGAFRVSAELLRGRGEIMRAAIGERA